MTATVAVNVAFWLAVDHAAATRQHLSITLKGPSVEARLDAYPPAVWDGAPEGNGRLGIAIRERLTAGEAGLDRVVVKAASGGARVPPGDRRDEESAWDLAAGWTMRRGRLRTTEPGILWSRGEVGGDGTIEVDLVNVRAVDVFVRAADEKQALVLRCQDEGLAWNTVSNGQVGGVHGVVRYTLPERALYERYVAELASVLRDGYRDGWRFLGSYARATLPGLVVIVLLAVGWHVQRRTSWKWTDRLGRILANRRGSVRADAGTGRGRRLRALLTAVVVVAVCASAAGYSAFASRVYLEGIPHVQDSASYLLGAKAIASGHLRIPVDPALGPFFDFPLFFEHHDGYIYPIVPGLYFAGYPALLAIGYVFGTPWIVNPVLSGLTLGLLFLLCRELFGTSTGLLAVLLGAISPFARFQSASMLSHTTSLLFVTAALLALVLWAKRGRAAWALCSGAALGALLNVRPFDAAILAAYVGLVFLASLPRLGLRAVLRTGAVFSAGVVPFLLLFFGQSAAVGGIVNQAARDLLQWLPGNLNATRLRFDDLNYFLFGWPLLPGVPPELTIGLLLVALLVVPKTRADWFVAGWAFLYVAGYLLTCWHANMFGPRYWFPSFGGQIVLVARLLQILPDLVTRLGGAMWPPGTARPWRALTVAAGAVPMAVVAGPLFLGTLKTFPTTFREKFTAYNGFTRAPFRLLAEHGVMKGLVFVADVPLFQDLVTGLASNDVSFRGDLIFARHIEGRDHLLIHARPDHAPYLITWNGRDLQLNRLRLDPVTNEVSAIPMGAAAAELLAPGKSDVFQGVRLPFDAALQGGLTVDPAGNLFVVDSADHAVLVFDAAGLFRRQIQTSYSFGREAITSGQGIARDGEGNVYVANFSPPGVLRFHADGTFAWRATTGPDDTPRLTSPIGVALLPGGDLVVTNLDPPDLLVLRRDGTFAGPWANGAARGELRRPYGVATGPMGHLWVSDAERRELLEFDENGRAVRRWKLPLQVVRPSQVPYVAVDGRGHAYVVDFNGWAVYHARPDKAEVELLGTSESLESPSGIAVRGDELLVVKGGANRILRLPLR